MNIFLVDTLGEMVNNDSAFESVDPTAARVINILTDDELEIPEGKEAINVCKAHEEMKKKAAQKANQDTAERMLRAKKYSVEEIADMSSLSIDEVKKIESSMLVLA